LQNPLGKCATMDCVNLAPNTLRTPIPKAVAPGCVASETATVVASLSLQWPAAMATKALAGPWLQSARWGEWSWSLSLVKVHADYHCTLQCTHNAPLRVQNLDVVLILVS
jgi:hypothetical protein